MELGDVGEGIYEDGRDGEGTVNDVQGGDSDSTALRK